MRFLQVTDKWWCVYHTSVRTLPTLWIITWEIIEVWYSSVMSTVIGSSSVLFRDFIHCPYIYSYKLVFSNNFINTKLIFVKRFTCMMCGGLLWNIPCGIPAGNCSLLLTNSVKFSATLLVFSLHFLYCTFHAQSDYNGFVCCWDNSWYGDKLDESIMLSIYMIAASSWSSCTVALLY